ncbi:unnamed protein product [Symbiodinium sp. CCMP2592]|nr:unnamed protein product [Symbiodinium sp. CCMP2592]
MTLQMDDNKRFTPSDWLLIQKTEFDKESNIRMSMSYGNLGEHMKKQSAKVEPALLPSGIRRLPENGELPGISKGWCSRVYQNLDRKRPEVHPTDVDSSAPRVPNGETAPRPAVELDVQKSTGPRMPELPSSFNAPRADGRTPLLARTVVNAPARLDCSRIREAARMPKSASSATLRRLDEKEFDGCRRTCCSSSIIFGK